jgi:hypothetical protein
MRGRGFSWRKRVSRRFERTSVVSVLMALVMIWAAVPSVLGATTAGVEIANGTGVTGATTDGKTYYTPGQSIADDFLNLGPDDFEERMSKREGMEMRPIPTEELRGLVRPDYARKASGDKDGSPSPNGQVDPEPLDAPFMTNDVLVYDDPANSESDPSLTKTADGTLYVTYDHYDPVDGNRDIYVSRSTDGGSNWVQRSVVADAGEDESCPSIASDYSPEFGEEMIYVWYNNPELEFSWSSDGTTWSQNNFGLTFWNKVNCPYVAVSGDFIVVVAEEYDDQTMFQDTWYILYTIDNFQTTVEGYYWVMWDDGLAYRPRVTIVGNNEVLTVVNVDDRTDANPSNWWNDALMGYGVLTGDQANDDWPLWQWGSGDSNTISTSPTVASNGSQAVVYAQELYDPIAYPMTTSMLFCSWTADITAASVTWVGCNRDNHMLAFDPSDTYDQKFPHIIWEDNLAHAVWLNGTNLNYKYSLDGGNTWVGDPLTGSPLKVNQVGAGTALLEWHSPDVVYTDGKPRVVWHDTRGSESIYFQTLENAESYTIDTSPRMPQLQVREVGDGWHTPPYLYVWSVGSNHDIEAVGSYELPSDSRYTFNRWDDGSTSNPYTFNAGVDTEIVAIYDTEYWLEMTALGGTVTPSSGYLMAGSTATIEAFPPGDPPGGRYLWGGWTGVGAGSYTGPMNPCVNCVQMTESIEQIANWQLQWNVTMKTEPSGLTVEVEGVPYIAPSVVWLNDSQLININAPSPQVVGPLDSYTWSHWSDAGTQSHDVSVTSPWTNFTAYFMAEFWMTIDTNPTGLNVMVNGIERMTPHSFWCPMWSYPWLEAIDPQYPGPLGERYSWSDWSDGGARTHQHNCSAPATIIANYTLQRSVNITTNPAGLDVIVDGLPVATPIEFWWDDASVHTLEALAVIMVGPDSQYNFTGWSDLGARVHSYWANTSNDLVTAFYDFQHKITFQANHPGISIDLDGSPILLPYVFWCDDGLTHSVSATALIQSGDTRYVFQSWSDGGSQSHMILCDAPMILQVDYDKEYRIYINSTLDGSASTLDVSAGGMAYPTPTEVWWLADTMMDLDADEFQPGLDPVSGIRFKFADWDDSSIKSRTIAVSMPGLAYVANFKTQYKLTFVDPHGSPTTSPLGDPVAGGFYFDAGISVDIQTNNIVTDTFDHRWRFDGWTSPNPGGYTGLDNPTTIAMSTPITQTAAWRDQYLLGIYSAYGTPVVNGWQEQQSMTQYWYDAGDIAVFWVEAEVIITAGEKVVFEDWTGAANGTVMNSGINTTANWHLEFLVTVVSDQGTVPDPTWVIEGGLFLLGIEEYIEFGASRHYFTGWVTVDFLNGGYLGPDRQVMLTVTGPLTETATWETQHLLTVISDYGTPTISGWADQHNATAYWYADGNVVALSIENEVFISLNDDEKALFDGWSGGSNGMTMNSPATVTAMWNVECLVTVESDHGTVPSDAWVREGQTHQISIEALVEHPTNDNIRFVFGAWSTEDLDSGGYKGTEREPVLTVTGPIKEIANWVTEYQLRITSVYKDEPGPIGAQTGDGWYANGTDATVEVPGSAEIGDYVYKFERWIGPVVAPSSNKTTVLVDSVILLEAEWSRSEKSDFMAEFWWLFIVIAVVVGAAVAALLVRRRKKPEEEQPLTEEEAPNEERDKETDAEESNLGPSV